MSTFDHYENDPRPVCEQFDGLFAANGFERRLDGAWTIASESDVVDAIEVRLWAGESARDVALSTPCPNNPATTVGACDCHGSVRAWLRTSWTHAH